MDRKPCRAEGFVLLFFVCLALLLRFELLRERSLWIDEALSLKLAEQGPRAILATTASAEPHPPGYYLMLWLWTRALGLGITQARLLSLVFGTASVVLVWVIGRQLTGATAGILAAALVALNPFQIFASNEIRMYMPLQFVGLLATAALWTAVRTGEATWWVAYGVLAACVAWLSYYGFLLLSAHGFWLLPRLAQSAPQRVRYALALGAGALAYSAWLPNLWSSITSNPVPWRPPPTPRYIADVMATQAFGGHVWGAAGYLVWPPQGSAFRSTILALPFLGLAFLAVRHRDREGRAGLLICAWAVPVATAVGASLVLGRVAAYEYHLTYVQPYLAILVAAGLVALGRILRGSSGRVAVLAVSAGLLAILAAGVNGLQAAREYQVFRFDAAARFLKSLRAGGDVVIYYNDVSYEVLRWYAPQVPPYIRVRPSPRAWSREAAAGQLRRALSALKDGHRRVWLVLCLPVPDGSFGDLVEWLAERGYKQTVVADFGGVRVVGMLRPDGRK